MKEGKMIEYQIDEAFEELDVTQNMMADRENWISESKYVVIEKPNIDCLFYGKELSKMIYEVRCWREKWIIICISWI